MMNVAIVLVMMMPLVQILLDHSIVSATMDIQEMVPSAQVRNGILDNQRTARIEKELTKKVHTSVSPFQITRSKLSIKVINSFKV